MDAKLIEQLCKDKEQQLLEKHFGRIVKEAAELKPEVIGDYSPELPLKIEEEYYHFLGELWKRYAPDDPRTIDDLLDQEDSRNFLLESTRRAVAINLKKAMRINLWERIFKLNHNDVTHYKGVLKLYAKELMEYMRCDIMKEIEEMGNKMK